MMQQQHGSADVPTLAMPPKPNTTTVFSVTLVRRPVQLDFSVRPPAVVLDGTAHEEARYDRALAALPGHAKARANRDALL